MQYHKLTIWVAAEPDCERTDRIVAETDEFVRIRADVLYSRCKLQEETDSNFGLDPEEECKAVIYVDHAALTDPVGSSPGIESILHEVLDDGTWGVCRRLIGRNTKIEIDIHQMETKTEILKSIDRTKESKVVETDAHERLHAYDWKIYGSWAGNDTSKEERHNKIYDHAEKWMDFIGDSLAFWEFQCSTSPALILEWIRGWGHGMTDKNYCVIRTYLVH